MILDLHNHSLASDDGRAKVENYCQWIRKREVELDGFVLTEHRKFDADSDYARLAAESGLVILKASEVETDYGHVLVFGVNDAMLRAFDFARLDNPIAEVIRAVERCGGIAVPCHPGRPRVGLCAHYEARGPVEGVRVVEVLNGGSRGHEDAAAEKLASEYGYRGVGGSDAHIVSQIGRCVTRFPAPIRTVGELVEALRAGEFEAISWKST